MALLRSAAGRLAGAARCSAEAPLAHARDRAAACSTSGRQALHSGRPLWAPRRRAPAAAQAAPAAAPAAAGVTDE